VRLTVSVPGATHVLDDDQVWYVVAAGPELSLTTTADSAGQVAYFVRLIAGWYLRVGDPARAALHLDGRPIGDVSNLLHDASVRLSRGPVDAPRAIEGDPYVSGYDEAALVRALCSACPTYDALEELLLVRLGVELTDLAGPDEQRVVAAAVVRVARANGWLLPLLTAIGREQPRDPDVGKVLPPGAPEALESIVNAAADFLDPMVLGEKLIEYVPRVCRVVMRTRAVTRQGTGFLVGPDLVLTNHHVLTELLAGTAPPASVRCKFDYRVVGDDVEHGTEHGLASRWRLADSPPSAADWDLGPLAPGGGTSGELDYALVRLDSPVGVEVLPSGVQRGWCRLPDPVPALRPGMRLLILQHPRHEPIKLAFEHDGVLALNGDASRVTHRVNTLGGSSGAPCFTDDFELVAVHHAGFGNSRNEAIPIAAIAGHLRSAGRAALLA
jgi:hypothetical protein